MVERPDLAKQCYDAYILSKNGKAKEGWDIINRILVDNPHYIPGLSTGSYVMLRCGGPVCAYHLAYTGTVLKPDDSASWTNRGHAASEMWLVDEAEHCYNKALECVQDESHRRVLWLNLSALRLDNGRFKEAEELTRKILEIDPGNRKAIANLGFCQLAQRNWAEGWKGYRNTIGSVWRPKTQYGEEPEWDGTPGLTVALYGDQGLGDEISFSSMLPDAIDHCKKVIVDCDERLEGLFRRSFPRARIYGTRRAKDGQWAKDDWQIDASLPLGQIGEYYRTTQESFPGTPYLIPCPERTKMWEGLFSTKGKPVIGIAWTGGIPKTNSRNRKVTLEDLLPIFRRVKAHYVSLQYRDSAKEIAAFRANNKWVDLVQYKWGTLTNDYDDTAALIAACDYVLCIQTAVAHTAGAVGTPVSVLVPTATQWRYGTSQDTIPWYECLRVIRQQKDGEWSNEIDRVSRELQSYFSRVPGRAGTFARDDELRDSFIDVRPDSLIGGKPNGGHPST
jgi:tetratricopeptide (TPR) repeat protein